MAYDKINFFKQENGIKVWVGEGKVQNNGSLIDCSTDFGTDNFDFNPIFEQIIEGEDEGSFSNEYETKYYWEIADDLS